MPDFLPLDAAIMDIDKIVETFNNRGFKASYFDDADIALEFLSSQIDGTTVGMGGSMTMKELGIFELLSKTNKVYSHADSPEPNVFELAQNAETYLTSANAVSASGEIVNIDGKGNRVSSSVFGINRKRLFVICGTNKITEDLSSAIWRAKNIAAPMNARRLHRKTPCAVKADKCYDCNSPERICRVTAIHTRPMFNVETHLVLIKGNYGY